MRNMRMKKMMKLDICHYELMKDGQKKKSQKMEMIIRLKLQEISGHWIH